MSTREEGEEKFRTRGGGGGDVRRKIDEERYRVGQKDKSKGGWGGREGERFSQLYP